MLRDALGAQRDSWYDGTNRRTTYSKEVACQKKQILSVTYKHKLCVSFLPRYILIKFTLLAQIRLEIDFSETRIRDLDKKKEMVIQILTDSKS